MKKLKIMQGECTVEEWSSINGKSKLKINVTKYSAQLAGELKGFDTAKYEGQGLWVVKDCPRNRFTLDLLSGGGYNGAYQSYCTNGSSGGSTESYTSYREGMWEHQRRSFLFKINRKRVVDAGEMGVGKTLSTLRALKYFREVLQWYHKFWWIAPNSGLTSLRTQLKKWDIHFVNWKLFNYHSLEREMEQIHQAPQVVVFDECHALKNPGARRTQLAITLTEEMEKVHGDNCAVIGLTGTPAPEDHFDWWSICEVIRPGWLREASFNKFKYRIAEFGTGQRADGGSYPQFLKWRDHEIQILPKRLEGLVQVTWKKDCLDLPEKVYEVIEVEPAPEILRAARMLKNTASRAIELHNKLRQLSDGFQYVRNDEGERSVAFAETKKDEVIRELLQQHTKEEGGNNRIVIYAAFTASMDKLTKICLEEGWNVWRYDGRGQLSFHAKSSEIGRVNFSESIYQDTLCFEGRIVFLGNPEAAGQGLTLTPAATIVYYSNSFKSQYRVQSEDRIHRFGASKERGCRIIDIVHLPTDRLVIEKLHAKREVEENTLSEIEALL